jgi:ribose 5-phosphate isomerase B
MIECITAKLGAEQSGQFAVGCDHGGFKLKQEMIKHLKKRRITFYDFGSYDESPVDYPEYTKKVTDAILLGGYKSGLLICGTGIGISMAANRSRGIRAALCHDVSSAKVTRDHNDANILVLGGRVVDAGLAAEILDAFIDTRFSGENRHMRRIGMMD